MRGDTKMDYNRDGQVDSSELRLTGLILAQSALIGTAVGVFDSGIWLPAGSGSHTVNGMTYAMGALAVQILAYYLFKMFFERSMKDRVNTQNLQRDKELRLREIQTSHEQRRIDMELRVQEMQLEREMHLFRQNPELFMQSPETITVPVPPRPTNTPPNNGTMSLGLDQLHQNPIPYVAPRVPQNIQHVQQQVDAMADEMVNNQKNIRLKKDGTPDMRYYNGKN